MLQKSELQHLSIIDLHKEFKKQAISPVEVVELLYDRIHQFKHLNTYITLNKEIALKQAKQAENRYRANNTDNPLLGIPIGIKDLIYTKEIRTTMGSGVYQNFIPSEDAKVIKNMKEYGAVITGKHNMHELAYGTTGDDSYFGPTRNPYNPDKITGGSSSGSAAAVASGLCWGAIGTDTSGSIRIPSSLCGVVGMKPTYGKIKMDGVKPLSWSMDHVGPITRTVMDNGVLFDGLCGNLSSPNSISENLDKNSLPNLKNTKIGVPSSYFFDDLDREVEENINNSINLIQKLGATLAEINMDIPNIDQAMDISSAIDQAEAYLINQDIVHDYSIPLGEETRKRFLHGSEYRAYEYINAQKLKSKLITKFKEEFKKVDVILTPTVPILPTEIGTNKVVMNNKSHNIRQVLMRLTFISNYIGIPSITIPSGLSSNGYPIGVQLIGDWNQDQLLYKIAYQLEKAFGFNSRTMFMAD